MKRGNYKRDDMLDLKNLHICLNCTKPQCKGYCNKLSSERGRPQVAKGGAK